ncbi:MAG TPA: hypothetical protein ENN05_01965, partial [Deltaproteobacteria bacterium]|nr:hypothetical protein [Deltaproteobacteria bacterium]
MSIDREKKSVTLRALENDSTFQQTYEKLVIATGARAIVPPLPGVDLAGVFPLKEFQDGINLRNYIEQEKPEHAVIIGGGYIGVEVSESFRKIGMDVTLVEAMPRIMA